MKRLSIVGLILIISFIAYNIYTSNDQKIDNDGTYSNELQLQPVFTAKTNMKIAPLFSEEIKILDAGVEMVDNYFISARVKGEDGHSYYFREAGEQGNEKIIFYKDNKIKVCETVMPTKLRKEGCSIFRFVQYKDRIFVELRGRKSYLSAIQIANGKWEDIIENSELLNRIFVYDNDFVCVYDEKVEVHSFDGEKRSFELEQYGENTEISIQCIIDGKIYYFYTDEDSEKNKTTNMQVKCCDLAGKNKKLLFYYEQGSAMSSWYDSLRIEKEYMYLLRDYTLLRIPLYGGKIERVSGKKMYFYDISDNYIFFLDEAKGNLYKINKDLSGEVELVRKPGPCDRDVPFICVKTYILVKECNEKQEQQITDILENGLSNSNIQREYISDYCWMTENGEVQEILQGSGFKKKWQK